MSLYSNSVNLYGELNLPVEGPYDTRHIGSWVTYAYDCIDCGEVPVAFAPDYPYCGPPTTHTCPHCASAMRLHSPLPILGHNRMEGGENLTVTRGSIG